MTYQLWDTTAKVANLLGPGTRVQL